MKLTALRKIFLPYELPSAPDGSGFSSVNLLEEFPPETGRPSPHDSDESRDFVIPERVFDDPA